MPKSASIREQRISKAKLIRARREAKGRWIRPIWVRPDDAALFVGLSRTVIYEFLGTGKIRTKKTRVSEDSGRTATLIYLDSLVDYIEELPDVETEGPAVSKAA